jgi:ParB family chromosome partitioning protein
LRELDGEPADLTEEEQGTLDALNNEYAKIEADYQDADELPDEIDQRLGEIETVRSALEARSLVYNPADIARAGVFISIDAEGLLSIDRGYVRPEDEVPEVTDPENEPRADDETSDGPRTNSLVKRAVITVGGASAEPVEEDDDTVKPLPDRRTILQSPSRRCCIILCWQPSTASHRRAAAWRLRSGPRRSPLKLLA